MSLFTLAQEPTLTSRVDTITTIFDRVIKVIKRHMRVLDYFFFITVDNIFVQSGEVASRQTRSKTYSDITGVFDKKSNSMAWSLIVKCM